MRRSFGIFCICLPLVGLAAGGAVAEDNPTGARIKKDAKALGVGVKNAAVSVGKQIGTGTKKTVKSIGNKISKDAGSGTPGDGSARRENERNATARAGRD